MKSIIEQKAILLESVSSELEHLLFIGIPSEIASMIILKRIGWDSKPPTKRKIFDVQEAFPFLTLEQVLLTEFVSQELKLLSRVLGNLNFAFDKLIERVKRQDQHIEVAALKTEWENLLRHVKTERKKYEKGRMKRKSSETQTLMTTRSRSAVLSKHNADILKSLTKPHKRKKKKDINLTLFNSSKRQRER